MNSHKFIKWAGLLSVTIFMIATFCCAPADEGKIPITTSSKKALKLYLQGRDLAEKLRGQESLQFFEKAVAEDTNFAMAYFYFAFNQPTFKGFFEQLDKAVSLVDKVTEGEKLWILGVQAGVNANPMKQREYYQKLVTEYPNDERAHNLLATNYFGQQEYELAIEEYKKATEIAPDFSPPHNQLGYAYRTVENYTEAENAFKKYIELIPDDPNPYDSYAELLMKMGKYDESIEQYQKALTIDSNFVASHIGIATNLNFKDQYEEARNQCQKLYDIARDDGEQRQALFAKTASYVEEGSIDKALEELEKQYALGEKINDHAAMAFDLNLMGNILFETGKFAMAMANYEKSVQLIEESTLSQEIKDNTKRGFIFNSARVALMKKDFDTAKAKAEEYRNQVKALNNPTQIRLSHELAGMIALEEKDYDKALTELDQANQQNPYNLYRIAQAYEGKGDKEKAKEFYKKASVFNALNSLNYAFVRSRAKEKLAEM